MATATSIKKTRGEVVYKVSGEPGTATIALADLALANEVVTDAFVTVTGATFVGQAESVVTVTRGETNIFTWQGPGVYPLVLSTAFVDNIEADKDITVTIAGAEAQVYLVLRKAGGYKSSIELAEFGAHDDPTKVGE